MGTLVKLLLAILAGYAAAVLAGVISFGELHPGGVLYLLWVVIMFTLPITPPALAGYFLLIALAMFAFILRRKPFWLHAGMTMAAGLFGAAIISWLVTLNGLAAKSMFSVAFIPVIAAALAIVACVGIPFPSCPAKTEPLHMTIGHRRSTIVVSVLLTLWVGTLLAWLFHRHHETKIWDHWKRVSGKLLPWTNAFAMCGWTGRGTGPSLCSEALNLTLHSTLSTQPSRMLISNARPETS